MTNEVGIPIKGRENLFEGALLILDWGIGGIGAFIEVRKRRPDLNILYWSDSGAMPYGKMSQAMLSSRILEVLNIAEHLGATHALIACNAASTILPIIDTPIPTLGVIRKGVEKLIRDKNTGRSGAHIGIIGGMRTIESRAWSQPLVNEGFQVSSKIAQPLSAIIEAGHHLDPNYRSVFEEVLSGLEDVSDLVLACTHYVVAADVISSILPNAILFDPVDICITFALEHWTMKGSKLDSGHTRFVTTGSIQEMEKNAKLAYNINIKDDVCIAPKS